MSEALVFSRIVSERRSKSGQGPLDGPYVLEPQAEGEQTEEKGSPRLGGFHGFIEVLMSEHRRMRRDRALLATHDGKLPPQFGDLATLVAFAIIVDFEGVTEGTWLPQV